MAGPSRNNCGPKVDRFGRPSGYGEDRQGVAQTGLGKPVVRQPMGFGLFALNPLVHAAMIRIAGFSGTKN